LRFKKGPFLGLGVGGGKWNEKRSVAPDQEVKPPMVKFEPPPG
jgi:hypothetical protein